MNSIVPYSDSNQQPSVFSEKFLKRFWQKIDKNGSIPEHCPEIGQCWVWAASTDTFGYGHIRLNPTQLIQAHRASYIIAYGSIPDDLFVLHKCDNPRCCRPSHLWLGTKLENSDDMRRKGRDRKAGRAGESHWNCKLLETDIAEIRRLYSDENMTLTNIARQFGISVSYVHQIVNGKYRKPSDVKPKNDPDQLKLGA